MKTVRVFPRFFMTLALVGVLTADAESTFVETDSTVVDALKYESDSKTLTVRLVDGSETKYRDVPSETYRSFLAAPMKGGYYRTHIQREFEAEPLKSGSARVDVPSPTTPVTPAMVEEARDTFLRSLNRAENRVRGARNDVVRMEPSRTDLLQVIDLATEVEIPASVDDMLDEVYKDVSDAQNTLRSRIRDLEREIRSIEMLRRSDSADDVRQLEDEAEDIQRILDSVNDAEKALSQSQNLLTGLRSYQEALEGKTESED